jgi:hypothetical protein
MDDAIFVTESEISREEPTLEPLSYFFGAFLGDGCAYFYPFNENNRYGVMISCMDSEIVLRAYEDVHKAINDLRRGRIYNSLTKNGTLMFEVRWYSSEFTEFVINATNNKEKIPDYIWHASKKAQLDMLAGLMDADGTVVAYERGRESRRLFYRLIFTGKKGFVRQFADLCRVIGIKPVNIRQDSRDPFCYNFYLSIKSAVENGFKFHCVRKQEKLEAYISDSYGVKGGRPSILKPSETTRSNSHSE